jgi:predicted TIM-barrel fold metal-dependent hydrolase
MSATLVNGQNETVDMTANIPIVSCDGHIGPRLSDLRGYCPQSHLDRFDAYAVEIEQMASMMVSPFMPDVAVPEAVAQAAQSARMREAQGAHDMHARLRDMDRDGVAAELIFHGVQDLRPIPWVGLAGFNHGTLNDPETLELNTIGLRIYNQWLADACSIEPERHVGAVVLPIWDIDASVREMKWARDAGLKAVKLPAPRRGLRFYDDPAWEPFWASCADLEMPLVTHAGAMDSEDTYSAGPHAVFLAEMEAGGWPGRRALNRMIFSGVFERYPHLKMLFVEQNHNWWNATIQEMDSAYQSHSWMVRDQMPKPPSEYLRAQVFIGASFMAPFEAEAAIREGFVDNVMWGRDYPHVEGTWQPQQGDDDQEIMTRLSIRYAFSGVEPRHARALLSDNGIKILNLDGDALQKVADRIVSPTLSEVGEPIKAIPEPGRGGILSFRTLGPWG